jgi:5,10-methylenetetrahydromethanopterin reductase
MKFGLRIPACDSATVVAEQVARAEAGGFDYAWVPDTQLLSREVWMTLAVAASRTSRIQLGPNVTNPLTRHATVTAASAATLDELSGGRALLGIGSGHSSVRVMGWPTARLAQLQECVEVTRALLGGEWVAPHGKSFRLKAATGRRVPIYIAAAGPKMLQLAGQVADGVILAVGVSAESLDYALTNVELGAKRAGRRLEDLDLALGTFSQVAADWRSIKQLFQPYAANYAIRHRDALRDAGVPVPAAGGEAGLYPDLIHAEDWQQAIEVTSWVPDEVLEAFCERFCLLGTVDDIVAKIRTLAAHGVQHLFIRDPFTYTLPHDLCEAYATGIIPSFR